MKVFIIINMEEVLSQKLNCVQGEAVMLKMEA